MGTSVELWVYRIVGSFTVAFLALPMVVVMMASLDPGTFFTFPPENLSLHWFREFLQDPQWRSALGLSLQISVLSALVSTTIGTAAGLAISRIRGRWRVALYGMLAAPLTIPVIVIGIAIYGTALRAGAIGSLSAFVVATSLLATPLVAIIVLAAALKIDERLEYASLACGASRWRTMTRITVPLIAPAALAGGVLSFLVTMDEVVMSLFLVGPGRTPLAVRLFLDIQQGTPPLVTAVSTLLMLGSAVLVGVVALGPGLLRRFGLSSVDILSTGVARPQDPPVGGNFE